MTWFYVDDHLHEHPKARRAGLEAMGMWALAGSYCADHLTDGFVPGHVPVRWSERRWRKLAQQLVAAGLWTPAERDGEPGWQFHDWPGWQKTRDQVLAEREAAAERQRRRRANGSRGTSPVMSQSESRRDSGVSHTTPSRPVPSQGAETPPTTSSSGPPTTTTRGSRLPDDFAVTDEMRQWARAKVPAVPASEHERFCDYWRGQPGAKGRKVDWVATWRNWMRKAADDIASGRRPAADGGRRSTTDERVAQAASLMDVARELDERDAAQDALVIDITDHRAIGG